MKIPKELIKVVMMIFFRFASFFGCDKQIDIVRGDCSNLIVAFFDALIK